MAAADVRLKGERFDAAPMSTLHPWGFTFAQASFEPAKPPC
jgi:hypothetical protein